MHIIIPAAGKSQRFKDNGFRLPKSLIKISNKMMIEHVIDMFDDEDIFHLIFTKQQYKIYKIKIDSIINKVNKSFLYTKQAFKFFINS